jgi:hypothetical protein
MQVIDVDSHVAVTKGLDGSALRVEVLPDGSHSIEFNRSVFKFAAPGGKFPRPCKESILARVHWDLDRRLEDLDRDGIARQVPITWECGSTQPLMRRMPVAPTR